MVGTPISKVLFYLKHLKTVLFHLKLIQMLKKINPSFRFTGNQPKFWIYRKLKTQWREELRKR
jgi:hypothetical protein